jgi:hypothetical protein
MDSFRKTWGMLYEHWQVFYTISTAKKLWILVRQTNVWSLDYVGQKGYTPKPIECKAKTADCNPGGIYKVAGLVVDPTKFLEGQVFAPDKEKKARKAWQEFAAKYLYSGISLHWEKPKTDPAKIASSAYAQGDVGQPNKIGTFRINEDPKSKNYGCVQVFQDGEYKYMHGDYDLKDVVDAQDPLHHEAWARKTKGTIDIRVVLPRHNLRELVDEVNKLLGWPMVQHGAEAQFAADADEPINVFGPQGQTRVLPDEAAVKDFYRNAFRDPKTGEHRQAGHGIQYCLPFDDDVLGPHPGGPGLGMRRPGPLGGT